MTADVAETRNPKNNKETTEKINQLTHTIIRIFDTYKNGGGNTVNNNGDAMMVVVFTNTEISYLVVVKFNDLVPPFWVIYL